MLLTLSGDALVGYFFSRLGLGLVLSVVKCGTNGALTPEQLKDELLVAVLFGERTDGRSKKLLIGVWFS